MSRRTLKQIRASQRNWAKARLLGTISGWRSWPISEEEAVLLKQIDNLREELLHNWDKNTERVLK